MSDAQPGLGRVPPAPAGESDERLLERFVRLGDPAAFEALVRRHGPMVLGVCRRALRDEHAAEDAFQTTFLVLVRRAAAIGEPRLLANWLYGVAFRVAHKARSAALRRAEHERQAAAMAPADPLDELTRGELRSLLEGELYRLPEKYRAPLVLCYLEGKTHQEAARQLGWPVGSMSARLARGRELLRGRLAQRCRSLPAGAFGAMLARDFSARDVPAGLVDATVRAALARRAGLPERGAPLPGGKGTALLAALLLLGRPGPRRALPGRPPTTPAGLPPCGAAPAFVDATFIGQG
jgi:RNA polymerase sigma factor (sigma-70 family)